LYQMPLLRIYRKHDQSLQRPTSWIKLHRFQTTSTDEPLDQREEEEEFLPIDITSESFSKLPSVESFSKLPSVQKKTIDSCGKQLMMVTMVADTAVLCLKNHRHMRIHSSLRKTSIEEKGYELNNQHLVYTMEGGTGVDWN
ncbi:hypothetical protein L9F63_026109, partial [Diploptera punctata]